MERLIRKNLENTYEPICRFENCEVAEEDCPLINEMDCECYKVVVNRLAELERKIEEGELVTPDIENKIQENVNRVNKKFEKMEGNILDQLEAYYKLKQEIGSGLRPLLPCKVKDTVYWISPFQSGIQSGYVDGILISKFGFDLKIMSLTGVGVRREWEKVFSSREAAEAALLKERENEQTR